MRRVSTVAEVRQWASTQRAAGRTLALVPTMGALHAGHLSLVAVAQSRGAAVAMSVFVNPTQFGPGEDWERYPRDVEADAAKAEAAGVELLFAPGAGEMYPGGEGIAVDPGQLAQIWEGAQRPGHFRGVATVVAKLLNVFTPDLAVFGQKDAQQVVVVRQLIRQLHFPTRLLVGPTVRDHDGVALSSRNVYLDERQRRAAPVLRAALEDGLSRLRSGERDPRAVEEALGVRLATEPLGSVDYAAAVAADTLERPRVLTGRVLLLVAMRFGSTRLLDNACVEIVGREVQSALP